MQKTEDLVGPYELHDFFLYHLLRFGSRPRKLFRMAKYAYGGRYPDDVIRHWLKTFCRRFFQQQFKRSCIPDGPKVGSVTLSPRGDWRMPSDASAACGLRRRKRSDSPFFTPARLTSGVQRAMIVTDFVRRVFSCSLLFSRPIITLLSPDSKVNL